MNTHDPSSDVEPKVYLPSRKATNDPVHVVLKAFGGRLSHAASNVAVEGGESVVDRTGGEFPSTVSK